MLLNFCAAGETMLCQELLPIVKELIDEGHYVMIVTNGVITPKFMEISQWSEDLKKRLFIKFSYHYVELKTRNLLETFFDNVRRMQDSRISYTVELTPSDIYIPYIEELKRECVKYTGALPHVTVCREEKNQVPIMSRLSRQEYSKLWSQFDSELFRFKMKIFGEKRREFCYAGAWSYTLSILNGDLYQCYRGRKIQNIYENIEQSIQEEPIGCYCMDPHCWNGHAFLAFGVIPEMKTPAFEQERNRKTSDGYWITKDMRDLMSSKLNESNQELDPVKKKYYNKKSARYYRIKKIKAKIKKILGQ